MHTAANLSRFMIGSTYLPENVVIMSEAKRREESGPGDNIDFSVAESPSK
jgi:hypothetical protein